MAQPPRPLTRRLLSDALLRYRIMSYVVGVMLILVFATIPFQSIDSVLGPIHGVLYLIYLITVVNLLVVYRLGLWTFVGMVAAGWCPFPGLHRWSGGDPGG